MIRFKIRGQQMGNHVGCDLFVASGAGDTYAKSGSFVLRVDEFRVLEATLRAGRRALAAGVVGVDFEDAAFEAFAPARLLHAHSLIEETLAHPAGFPSDRLQDQARDILSEADL